MTEFEYLKPRQIVQSKQYPFTMGQLRHFLKNRHKNKLCGAVRKCGKSLIIRRDLFDLWIESQAEKGGRS